MKYLYFIFLLLIVGCSSHEDSSEGRSIITGKYEDGTYCADVTYHNPNTGTRHTYTLNVEVEDNELTKIYWGNGGWLDESHFSPEELDSQGYCSFTSDKGYNYDVQINGKECSSTDEPKASSDEQEEKEKSICPKCGGEKDEFDTYCYWCKRKIEDKEEHTCPKCGQYDSYMYRSDGECSDCKRKREDEEEEERRKEEDN
jgi:predicted RNA-binding Zn-ribbon protein involved in translation (DUF1610 family)